MAHISYKLWGGVGGVYGVYMFSSSLGKLLSDTFRHLKSWVSKAQLIFVDYVIKPCLKLVTSAVPKEHLWLDLVLGENASVEL